jgi:hypothetical protein
MAKLFRSDLPSHSTRTGAKASPAVPNALPVGVTPPCDGTRC